MKRIVIFSILGILFLSLISCGGGKTEAPSKFEKVFQPDWYRKSDDTGAYVYTYGMAEKASETMSITAAKSTALMDAAMYVETYVKGMMKNFEQEAGVENPRVLALTEQVSKSVAKAKFQGIEYPKMETYENSENGKYKTFVRAAIPIEQVQKKAVDHIKNEEALYNEFKSSQSFQEMEKEVENY